MKISNDTIVIRTRDLPACSAVPQQTGPPRVPNYCILHIKINLFVVEREKRKVILNLLSKTYTITQKQKATIKPCLHVCIRHQNKLCVS